jgi:hypothetical protein
LPTRGAHQENGKRSFRGSLAELQGCDARYRPIPLKNSNLEDGKFPLDVDPTENAIQFPLVD